MVRGQRNEKNNERMVDVSEFGEGALPRKHFAKSGKRRKEKAVQEDRNGRRGTEEGSESPTK